MTHKELTEQTTEYQTEEQPQRATTALALIPQGHAAVMPIHGMIIDVNADFESKLQAVATIDEMIGGESERIDKFLNTIVWAIGVAQHDATVRQDNDDLQDVIRTVLHVIATKGREHEPQAFSFTSRAVANYFETRIVPLFGIRFERPLPFRFAKVATRKGSTYSIQLVRDAVYPQM